MLRVTGVCRVEIGGSHADAPAMLSQGREGQRLAAQPDHRTFNMSHLGCAPWDEPHPKNGHNIYIYIYIHMCVLYYICVYINVCVYCLYIILLCINLNRYLSILSMQNSFAANLAYTERLFHLSQKSSVLGYTQMVNYVDIHLHSFLPESCLTARQYSVHIFPGLQI